MESIRSLATIAVISIGLASFGSSHSATLHNPSPSLEVVVNAGGQQGAVQSDLDCYEIDADFSHFGFDDDFLKFNCIAAKKNDAKAQYNVGQVYFLTEGVGNPNPGSLLWFSKAAARGLPQAQYALGILYVADRAVVGDSEKADQWILKAAENGQADAQYLLGLGFSAKDGKPKADTMGRSIPWLRAAVEQNHTLAKEVLSNICVKALAYAAADKKTRTINPFGLTQADCPAPRVALHVSEPGAATVPAPEYGRNVARKMAPYQPYVKPDLENAFQTDLFKYMGMMIDNVINPATIQGVGFLKN
jgi:hypothetical protein